MLPYKWHVHDDTIIVSETAPYGRMVGNQKVLQLLVEQFPTGEYNVSLHSKNFRGKSLVFRYFIRNGLYASAVRGNINWRNKDGDKVNMG